LLASVWLGGIATFAPDAVRAQEGPFAYVPTLDSNVTVIDTSTNAVAPTAIPVGLFPVAAAVRGDESLVYVTNLGSNTVSVINTATNTVVATIPVGNSPQLIAVSPDGTRAYVANQGSDTVSVISTSTNTVVATIPTGSQPVGPAVSPDGALVYVTNRNANTVSVISTATNTVVATIPVGVNPTGVTVTPDGTRAYVTNAGSDNVSVINTATNTVVTTIPLGFLATPQIVAVSPDGTRAYVTNAFTNTVSVINTSTNTVVATIPTGNQPTGVVVSPDGTRAYVTNSLDNTVSVINTATNTVVATLPVGLSPEVLGICSNGNALLAAGLTFTARTSGALACTLASGPTGAPGPVFTGGTLRFAGSNITSALPISLLAAGGTFDTNGNNATLSGTISGPGGLTKIGAGTLTLSGTNSYSGDTNVNGGTLFVIGSIANSHTFVNSGGTLTGTGTVGSVTVNSGGILAPGSGAAGSAMTVAGNLAFQSGALYLLQINPSSASGANVTGSATLAGTVNATFAAGSYIPRNYTILSANSGRNGTFASLTTSGLPAGFAASLSYTTNDVILNLSAALGANVGLNQNQQNVATTLNNFFNNGGTLPPNFLNVFGLTGSNLTNALTLLSGEPATGAQQGAFKLMDQFLALMLDPFVDGRSGVGGAGGPALGFAPDRPEMPEEIALAYSKVMKTPVYKATPITTFEQRWTAWGAGFGGYNKTSGDPAVVGSHDLSARTAGFATGMDYRFAPGTVAGFALAGGGTRWDLAQGLGGGRSDAFQAGIYAATRSGPAYLAASLAFANHWMSTDRFAPFGDHLTADFEAQSFGGRVEGGYRFGTPIGGVTPYAAVQAQSFRTPSYRETDVAGGGFALAYNARTGSDTRSELGARFDHVAAVDRGAVLTLRGRLAWAHDWITDPTLAAVFQALPGASFIVNGAAPAKDSALASAGAELRLANGVTLLGKFDGEFANHSQTYAGTGTIRYAW
jgi:YVTN family beta-propeller protein/autotransporter-associated beta strand protein